MNWKKIVGRALTVAEAVGYLVFSITGTTPTWWQAAIAIVVMAATVLIGEWKPIGTTETGS